MRHDGRTVAFGGRDLTGESPAKYMNSPETLIYKKSRVLYGLREAREAMQRERKAFVVEGYFDLLRCVDAGFENVVATCGTALTDGQAGLLRRYVPEVTVVFDGDAAGIKAACRALAVLAHAGLAVRAMALPGGQDPDDFIRSAGADAFRALAEHAPDFVTFITEMSPDRSQTVEGRTELVREIFEVIAAMDDEIRRDEYLKRTARALNLNLWKCRDEFSRYLRGQRPARPVEAAKTEAPPFTQDEAQFVAALLDAPETLESLRAVLGRVGELPGPLGQVLAAVAEAGVAHRALAGTLDGDALRLYAAAANATAPTGDACRQLAQKGLVGLEREALRSRAGRLQADLETAERTGDTARAMDLLQEKIAVEKRLRTLLGAA
jgi:DNA primase